MKRKEKEVKEMKRVMVITITATLAAIAWGILTRHGVAYGGEMIVPFLAAAYAIKTKEAKR